MRLQNVVNVVKKLLKDAQDVGINGIVLGELLTCLLNRISKSNLNIELYQHTSSSNLESTFLEEIDCLFNGFSKLMIYIWLIQGIIFEFIIKI